MLDSPAAIQFIDKMIEQKGLHGLDEEIRLQLRQDLLRQLEARVSRGLIGALSPTELIEFEHIIDTGKPEQLPAFLQKKGVNMQAVIAKAMVDFQASYLEAS